MEIKIDFLNEIYQKNDDIVFRKIANEYILVPIKKKAGEVESIFTLNDVAALIWDNIDGTNTVGDIVGFICEEFDVTAESAKKDIEVFLKQLKKVKAVEVKRI